MPATQDPFATLDGLNIGRRKRYLREIQLESIVLAAYSLARLQLIEEVMIEMLSALRHRANRDRVNRLAAMILVVHVATMCRADAAPIHSKAFWRGIVQNKFELPEHASVRELAGELSAMLASPDPELRDAFGYSILAAWIYQKQLIEPDDLRILMRQWIRNLSMQVGTTGDDSVFRRSFSALALSVVAARDNAAPFLEKAEFQQLLDAALVYLDAEKDLRGYDEREGWRHSAAHTADLLKFLARSRYLESNDQRRILVGIAGKLHSAAMVFTFGEDERFARAILSLVARADFDADSFQRWTVEIRPTPLSESPKAATIRANQNIKNLLAKLHAVLLFVPTPTKGVQTAEESVRAALKDLF